MSLILLTYKIKLIIMLNHNDQLTELVRELENKEHVFATDPLLITEKMQDEAGTPVEKLHTRAHRIDSNGKLARTLTKIDIRIKAIIAIMSIAWCASGFAGLFALLQANVVNFFYVLMCLLGFHTIMLVGWVVLTIFSKKDKPTIFASFVSPSHLIRGKDDVTTAAVNLYERQLHHSGMRWYLGKISHQLWLATLTGMLLALVVLLMVRDYNFAWESTLLSGETIASLVGMIAWLPDLLGFPTPTAEEVLQSQKFSVQSDGATITTNISSYQWAMLLISSLLIYGIVPRAILWAVCALLFNRKKMVLDINEPYYQKILDFWSRKVTNADDFIEEEIIPVAPKAELIDSAKLVATLEYDHKDSNWFTTTLKDNVNTAKDINAINNFGVLDSRDDMDRLLEYLEHNDVQVLLGIHSNTLPDRGTMRKLNKIATHAKHGLVVQLLNSKNSTADDTLIRNNQWQKALSEHQIGMVQS